MMDNNQPKRRRFYQRMPEIFRLAKVQMKRQWRNLMDSTQKKLSIGASKIAKIIPFARGDNWRRGDDKHHHRPK